MFETRVLHNGLRLIVTPIPSTRAVSIYVAAGVGFGYEAARDRGLSHFVEHMLFKGTRDRPSYAQITGHIESLGGIMNAATDKEMTSYFIKAPAGHFEAALEILADILLNSAFHTEEVERERKIILDEINTARDAPEDWAGQLFESLLWPNHGLGRPVSDGAGVIQRVGPKKLRQHMQRHYSGNNIVVSIAGQIEKDHVEAVVEKAFAELPPGTRAAWPPATASSRASRLVIEARDSMQVSLVMGTRTFTQDDPDRHALELLNAILGEGMCSRLFAEIRETRALSYDVYSYLSQHRDTGSIGIAANVDPEDVLDATEAIIGQCEDFNTQTPSDWEVERAREYVKGGLILGMEDSQNVAAWFAREELLEAERMTVEQVIWHLDQVTAEDIGRVARRVFHGDWVHAAAVGPVPDPRALGRLVRAKPTFIADVA